MTFTPENIFFLGAVLIFASIVISKWGYRFGVPTLLLFLFINTRGQRNDVQLHNSPDPSVYFFSEKSLRKMRQNSEKSFEK